MKDLKSVNLTASNRALLCIVQLLKHFEKNIELASISHLLVSSQNSDLSQSELIYAIQWAGINAEYLQINLKKLDKLHLPVLIKCQNNWLLLEAFDGKNLTVFDGVDKWQMSKQDCRQVWQNSCIAIANNLEEYDANTVQNVDIKKDSIFQWFLPSIKKHKKQFLSVIFISIMIQLIMLLTPLLFQYFLDSALPSFNPTNLQTIMIAMLFFALIDPMFLLMRSFAFSNLTSKIDSELTSRIYEHLMQLQLSFFQNNQIGKITAFMREMASIRQFMTGNSLTLVIDLIFVVVFFSVMFQYSVFMTVVVLIFLLIYFFFWLIIGPIVRKRSEQSFDASAENTALLTETLYGIHSIKSMATEQRFIRQWEKRLGRYQRAYAQAELTSIFSMQGISLINKIMVIVILWLGITEVLEGNLTIGAFIAFRMYSNYVAEPVIRLAQIWQDFQYTLVSIKKISLILKEPLEELPKNMFLNNISGNIVFKSVYFTYKKELPSVLSDINLTLKPGCMLGITGPSGSGKSTLTKLLQMFYRPTTGEILIDGLDIRTLSPTELRMNMGVVLQNSELFQDTLINNLKIANPDVEMAQIQTVAKMCGADFIEELPQGYNTMLSEKGGNLSGGQRQRIAFMRALINNPKILILDEATSALDYESERIILNHLPEIRKNRTIISVAHRLNTIKDADTIIFIDNGKITEQGTHQELIDKEGGYAKLYRLQQQT
ncbi:peptidase domain-containing ABC transporter [Bathymodiolus thermophilus thioautotrophic gill symbiont]|uniref:peptidase domain-containing ABC transporter n=1 Tax=Bathymodiolus thermophilus thioautotrophic gill symbiont TaxID=2360 RepID=UPI00192B3953|nr:type I secretion system permease/ATPase [Bathymodiolus thermophilus thioautotrophic gill symbiont]